MINTTLSINGIKPEKKTVNVAVAVIRFKDEFLLGYRNAKQHQGNRYEFVGGKIEKNETPVQALIREVEEEIGIVISSHQSHTMGIIEHDYSDKQVCLHVFTVLISQEQYVVLSEQKIGRLNQPIIWVDKSELLSNKYPLPDANSQIIEWIKDCV